MNMLLLILVSQNPAWWPTYGYDLANSHFSPFKGAMSSTPATTWQYTGAGYVERSPATAEIGDGDPNLETLVPGYNTGTLALVDGVTQSVQWTRSIGSNPISTAGMYNLDADPQLECVVSISNGVGTVCLDGLTGATQWTFSSAVTWGSAKVADFVPGNPGLEIIVGGGSGLYCLNSSGAQLWLASIGAVNSTPAALDIDGDGLYEIAVSSSTTLAVLEAENGAVKWSQAFGGEYGSPCLKDVTGDGVADVVVGNASGVVYCRNSNTGALNWSVTMMYPKCEAGAAAWDLDNNGVVEVIVGCNNSLNTAGCLYSINGATGAVNWTYPVAYGVHRAVSLIDVNGDNIVEILMPGCRNGGPNGLKCLRPAGTLLWEVSFSTAHDIHDPSNADIDGDGCAELIVGTYGVNAAWFLDDVGNASDCGVLETGEDPGYPETLLPEVSFTAGRVLLHLPGDVAGMLCLYDPAGRRVTVLISGEIRAGEYSFDIGGLVPGVYTAVFVHERGTASCVVPAGR